VSRALLSWIVAQGIGTALISAGQALDGVSESFNGKFRDECLNLHWFTSLHHAREIIAAWREEYNTQRPHSALHQQPPAIYAQTLFA
jgi:putative transposase